MFHVCSTCSSTGCFLRRRCFPKLFRKCRLWTRVMYRWWAVRGDARRGQRGSSARHTCRCTSFWVCRRARVATRCVPRSKRSTGFFWAHRRRRRGGARATPPSSALSPGNSHCRTNRASPALSLRRHSHSLVRSSGIPGRPQPATSSAAAAPARSSVHHPGSSPWPSTAAAPAASRSLVHPSHIPKPRFFWPGGGVGRRRTLHGPASATGGHALGRGDRRLLPRRRAARTPQPRPTTVATSDAAATPSVMCRGRDSDRGGRGRRRARLGPTPPRPRPPRSRSRPPPRPLLANVPVVTQTVLSSEFRHSCSWYVFLQEYYL